jgi:hypothetical protein
MEAISRNKTYTPSWFPPSLDEVGDCILHHLLKGGVRHVFAHSENSSSLACVEREEVDSSLLARTRLALGQARIRRRLNKVRRVHFNNALMSSR